MSTMSPASIAKGSETGANSVTASAKLVSQKSDKIDVRRKPDNKYEKERFDSPYTTKKYDKQISFGRHRSKFVTYPKDSYNKRSQQTNAEKKRFNAEKFRFGNFHQYYGYRNQGSMDLRLTCMKQEFFAGKDVLDIGCNAGHFTLAIARDFFPNSIIGMDIDYELVKMAMKNVRHYITPQDIGESSDDTFPISLVYSYGPIAQASDPKVGCAPGKFPFNVQFLQGDYILLSDELIGYQEEKFDTILCLSLTKWIHLNWGDEGIRRLFRRIFANLRPGGMLILEAQVWGSYIKKKNMTEETRRHYNEIKFHPEMFNDYLVNEVGFISCELIDTPAHSSKGFNRPIYLFIKSQESNFDLEPKVAKHVIYDECFYNRKDSDVEELSD